MNLDYQALKERVESEWDNGTFLGDPDDKDAAWIRSAMLVAFEQRTASDVLSHSLGFLADVVTLTQRTITEMDDLDDSFMLDSITENRLRQLRKLLDW